MVTGLLFTASALYVQTHISVDSGYGVLLPAFLLLGVRTSAPEPAPTGSRASIPRAPSGWPAQSRSPSSMPCRAACGWRPASRYWGAVVAAVTIKDRAAQRDPASQAARGPAQPEAEPIAV